MRRRRAPAVVFAAGLLLAGACHLLLRSHGRGIPLITDEGEYAAAARAWSEGGLPYRDAFSPKPPMILLAYRATAAVSSDPAAPRAIASLAGLLAMLALFFCVPAAWSPAARLAAPAALAALAALPIGDYGFTANTETLVVLFTSLTALGVLRGAPLLAGLAAGAALCSKQTSLWTLLAFGALAVLYDRRPARAAARYALGAAAVPAAWAAYFLARGAFGDYWSCAWGGNARYAATIASLGAVGTQLRWFATALLPRFLLFTAPALALAGKRLAGLRAGREAPVETLAVLWFGTAIAGALTGLFLFPHYFLQAAPALALAAAAGVESLSARPRLAAVAAASLALWPAVVAPAYVLTPDARLRALALLYPNPLFETKVMGEELARRASPGDRLHVFGSEGALFSYSGLRPATRHTLALPLTMTPSGDEGWKAEMSALEAAPPRFVVWSTQPLSTLIFTKAGESYRDAMRAFIDAHYRYEGMVRVQPAASLPVFAPARPGEAPDFASPDRFDLFSYWKK